MNAVAVVVLPGGGGSLDEFVEDLTMRQLGLHDNPIMLTNSAGEWSPLVPMIDQSNAVEFADTFSRGFIDVADSMQVLESLLQRHLG